MKECGFDKEAIPPFGRHIFRLRNRKINPRDAKIKLTFYIEGDVLQHFRQRADGDSEKFEKSLNKALRNAMEETLIDEEKSLNEVAEKLVNNSKFINAVSEKLKAA